ncbi:MAG: peptide chain release factor N(5)-glutamine methyltransferase [Alphaproteobacteria bacterium]|nr:peptide chain release factor N(5)-glutamine methyltransferase [Alphaproteobacteria bacterium]
MRLEEFLSQAIEQLKQAGIDNPQLDARLLFCHALTCDRAQLLSQSRRILNDEERRVINELMSRRMRRESVARIIGKREFRGLDFALNEATLEPRPDSETVVEAIVGMREKRPLPPQGGEGRGEGGRGDHNSARGPPPPPPPPPRGGGGGGPPPPRGDHNSALPLTPTPLPPSGGRGAFRILDLGTGTGCLLLSLLHEMPDATGLGIDINPRAIEQATINAASLHFGKRATFRTGNWLENIKERFDIIVSNPPYIPVADIPALMPEVRDYDPALALDGGGDGLTPYRLLIPQLADFLNPQGLIAFEVGQGQAQPVADLFRQSRFANIVLHKDLGGIERCVTAERPACSFS